jgi:hypothetical protein
LLAELYELPGFAFPDIVDAFRSVHVMAEATKCEQPFFHVQVRNPECETLNRDQWEYAANRIERMLGLKDQPRAIAFHVDEKTGDRHMRIAWSRIDDETMTAKELPFYKDRLKKISRELEMHFGISVVPNERESPIKYAPTRSEDEQARRLGLNPHEVRQTIRDCFEPSDGGRSCESALADEGMILAKGERRDFIVIDQAGGLHALGKRILDVPAPEVRDRLADLDRVQLPTVEQAQQFIREQPAERQQEKTEPVLDRDRDEIAWQTATIDAAIPKPPAHLKGIDRPIWNACERSDNAKSFAEALVDQKVAFAAVTKEEADRSHREAAFAREIGRYAPQYREGQIVAVTEPGSIYRSQNGEVVEARRVHRLDPLNADRYLVKLGIDPGQLKGIDATKEVLDLRAKNRAAFWEAVKLEKATRIYRDAWETGVKGALLEIYENAGPKLGKAAEMVANIAGEAIEMLGDMVGATAMTPERIEAVIDAKERRGAQYDIDMARFRSDADYRRGVEAQEAQKLEQERERSYYEQERNERQR